jgi:hypothetical protein
MTRLRRSALTPLLAGLLLGFGAVLVIHGVSRGSTTREPSEAAQSTPQDAVATFVRSSGGIYAGPCEQTRSPEDIGKVCSRYIDTRDGMQAFLIGRTFSEFSTWVFVRQDADGWSVAGSAPLDFNDTSMTIPWPR